MRHPGAVAGWLLVIVLFVLMLVWAAKERTSAAVFIGISLGLLILVPLLTRQPKE